MQSEAEEDIQVAADRVLLDTSLDVEMERTALVASAYRIVVLGYHCLRDFGWRVAGVVMNIC